MKREADIDYKRVHDLTVEEIRACPPFAHLSHEQAEAVRQALKTFTKIAYDLYKNERKNLENSR